MLEFNLDFHHVIAGDRERFNRLLSLAMTSPPSRRELKDTFGVTFVAMRHHSTNVAVVQNGDVVWRD